MMPEPALKPVELVLGILYEDASLRVELRREEPGKGSRFVGHRVTFKQTKGEGYGYLYVYVAYRSKLGQRLRGLVKGNHEPVHRVIAALAYGSLDGFEVHHLNWNHLDNRQENLSPWTPEDHQAEHEWLPRRTELPAPEDVEGLCLWVWHRRARTTMAARPLPRGVAGAVGVAVVEDVEGLTEGGAAAVSGRGGAYPPQYAGKHSLPGLEQSVDGWIQGAYLEGAVKTLWAKELSRFGLRGEAAKRAALVMRAIAAAKGPTVVTYIQAEVSAKGMSRRSLSRTLTELVAAGLVERKNRGRYELTPAAIVT